MYFTQSIFCTVPHVQLGVHDGYWCMVTGMFNSNLVSRGAELEAMATCEPMVTAWICHILNESMMHGLDSAGTSKNSMVVNKMQFHQVLSSPLYSPALRCTMLLMLWLYWTCLDS